MSKEVPTKSINNSASALCRASLEFKRDLIELKGIDPEASVWLENTDGSQTFVVSEKHKGLIEQLLRSLEEIDLVSRMRIKTECIALAENPYCDQVTAYGRDEPKAVGQKIALAILKYVK